MLLFTTRAMVTPLEALGLGMLAGLFASFVLSLLARLLPALGDLTQRRRGAPVRRRFSPDPFDPDAVHAWQDRERSPALQRREAGMLARYGTTPEAALVTLPGPGPEGAAEQFAVKVGAGLFDRDITRRARLAGKFVHFFYGSLWGGLFGLFAASARVAWLLAGALHGLLVWLIGPALLVPAMKLMLWPRELGTKRTLLVIFGHVVYGIAVALIYSVLFEVSP